MSIVPALDDPALARGKPPLLALATRGRHAFFNVAAVRATVRGDVRDVLACPQTKKAINPFDGRPMPCMFDPSCPAVLPDAQFERGSIGEYKPRSGCSPLHGGCAWMRTGHSTQGPERRSTWEGNELNTIMNQNASLAAFPRPAAATAFGADAADFVGGARIASKRALSDSSFIDATTAFSSETWAFQ